MRVVADDGEILDATFSVTTDPLSVIYESSGGKVGVNARNLDYKRGLGLILDRLRQIAAVVSEIRVESTVTRVLPLEQQRVVLSRHRLPIAMSGVADVDDLRRDISLAARAPGSRPGARPGGSSRRLRFFLAAARGDLEMVSERLAGSGTALDVAQVETMITVAAGRASPVGGQGFLASAEQRMALEARGMEAATDWYESRGWRVEDVHLNESYDLLCTAPGASLHVEVKATVTQGDRVLVTRGEVEAARRLAPATELFLLHSVDLRVDGAAVLATGGVPRVQPQWTSHEAALVPTSYVYRMPVAADPEAYGGRGPAPEPRSGRNALS